MTTKHFSWLALTLSLLALFLGVAPAAHAKKSPHKLTLGAQAGGGFDSNTFNKKNNPQSSFSETATIKAKYSFTASKRLKWLTQAAFGDAYRVAGSTASALKLTLKGKTGIDWKVFGAKSSKKHFKPNGKLSFNFGYSGTFNPQLNNPSENVDVIDEDDEVDDATLEDDITGDDEEAFADDEDGYGEDDYGEDDEDLDEEEDFFDEDPVGTQFFNSKPPRHSYTGSLGFSYNPVKPTTIGLSFLGSLSDIGETPGRVTSDATGLGFGVKVSNKFSKGFTFSGGYNFGVKSFDEKTTATGNSLRIVAHGINFGAQIKPLKWFKIVPAVRVGYTTIPANGGANTLFEQGRLGFDFKIFKWLHAFEENNIMLSGLTADASKNATRFQMLAGLRGSLDFWGK